MNNIMNKIQVQTENPSRQVITEFVESLVKERQQALDSSDIMKANEIQQELSRLRITLLDFRDGTRYKFN